MAIAIQRLQIWLIGSQLLAIFTSWQVCYAVKYKVPLSTGKWARYIDREIIVKPFLPYKSYGVFTQ